MPDSGLLFISLLGAVIGGLLFLSPHTLLDWSGRLNKTLVVLDEWLIRHRYVMGLFAFAASYAFFRLALLLPTL